jgi:hypothetical protein
MHHSRKGYRLRMLSASDDLTDRSFENLLRCTPDRIEDVGPEEPRATVPGKEPYVEKLDFGWLMDDFVSPPAGLDDLASKVQPSAKLCPAAIRPARRRRAAQALPLSRSSCLNLYFDVCPLTRLVTGATSFDVTVITRAGGPPNRAVLGRTQFGPPAV